MSYPAWFTLVLALMWPLAVGVSAETSDPWDRLSDLLSQRPDTPIRGQFEQERDSPILAEPIHSEGSFALADGLVRFDTEAPYPSAMLIDSESVTIYYPQERAVERYPFGGEHGPLGALMRGDLGSLQSRYTLSLAEGPGTVEVTLTGVRNEATAAESVRFLLDPDSGALREAVFASGDTPGTRLRFLEVAPDPGLSGDDLHLEWPDDVVVSDRTGDMP